jgi:hypothetical protein
VNAAGSMPCSSSHLLRCAISHTWSSTVGAR